MRICWLTLRILLFQFIFYGTTSTAQTSFSNYTISKLTPDDGLSQGSNYFRFEDSKGFMWLTCNDAINRYDGKMVKVYNLDAYFKSCPNLQQGYGFAEDSESNIYIGSTKGLYIYNRKQDNFTLLKIFKIRQMKLPCPLVLLMEKSGASTGNFNLQLTILLLEQLPIKHKFRYRN